MILLITIKDREMKNRENNLYASNDYSDKNPVGRSKKIDEFLSILTSVMNNVHDVSYSERFWRILLNGYVSLSLSQYQRFTKPVFLRDVILPTGEINGFKTLLFVYTKYLINLIQSAGKYRIINRMLKQNNNIYISALFENSRIQEDLVILPDYIYFPINSLKDRSKREKLRLMSEEYEDVYLKNIIKSVPLIFIEYFDFLMGKVKLFNPHQKTFNIITLPNSYSRYIVAKYTENGAELYGYQHGSNYGETNNHVSYNHEYKISDRFYTWGWKINENDYPFFAFRISPFINKYKSLHNVKNYDCLIVFGRFLSHNKQKYINKGIYFAQNIDRNKYPKIIARPRKGHKYENAKNNLRFLNTYNFQFHSGNRAETPSVIKQSKVVILLHYPSTFAFECMAVDHPIICIEENRDVSEMAMPFYDGMYELNIFHRNIESVVEFMNKTDINEWWNETVVDIRYINFKNNFLRSK